MEQIAVPYSVLRGNRNLTLLFAGQVISTFGDFLYVIALIVLAYDLTGSATVVAALTFTRLLPYALFLPLSGILADRWNRKRLMIVADVGRGLCMFGLLVVRAPETVWIAFPLVFATTALSSLFRPALSATLPSLVSNEDELVQANGLLSQIISLSLVLGPALGGLLVGLGQAQTAFLINGITFLLSAATLLLIHIPPRPSTGRSDGGSWIAETTAGYRFLFRENEGVLAAFTLAAAGGAAFGGAFWSLSVVLADQTFELGSEGTGYLNAAYGVGGLLGGFAAAPFTGRVRLNQAFIIATTASAIAAGFFGLSPAGWAPFLVIALLGITDVFVEITGTTVVQTGTPNDMLGRVFGAWESTVVGAMLIGSLVVGPLIDTLGPRFTTVVFAVIGVVVVVVGLPKLRRMEDVIGVRVFARQVPVLSLLPHRVLDDFATRVRLERLPERATIIRQGEIGDRIYLIKSGEVEVIAERDGVDETQVATLGKMDYFGEIALLRDVPRTATVRARGPVELYTLGRDDFHMLLVRSEELKQQFTGTSDTRYMETQRLAVPRL